MSQSASQPQDVDNRTATPQPEGMAVTTRATRQGELVEQVYFDGPTSLWGRATSIFWTTLVGIVLVGAPIVAAAVDRTLPWYVSAALVAAALVGPCRIYLLYKSTRYKISNYRVDFERGLLSTRIDSLELWRIDDIAFRQGLVQRLVGVGSIELTSDDKTNPKLVLSSLPNARQLFETLKTRIIATKRERGLLELDQ